MMLAISGEPLGDLGKTIEAEFGGIDTFQSKFEKAANGCFGVDRAWLVKKDERLVIVSTPSQDNPFSEATPLILDLDAWEDAYYLQHQSPRVDI
jgi:Fe-Mn family superoxide dismutase